MGKIARKPDTQVNIDRLERKYNDLKQQVATLDKQLYVSTREQLLITRLKKQKLATRDALRALNHP